MIRPLDPADIETIVAIGNRAWKDIYDMFETCYGKDLFHTITPDRCTAKGEQVRRHCQAHPDQVYVCEEQGQLVGFITFMLDRQRGIGEIGNNAVDPSMRGKGYAQHLYEAVFQRFRHEGMHFAKVTTGLDEAHAAARRAYQRAGFDRHHENITYYKRLDNS